MKFNDYLNKELSPRSVPQGITVRDENREQQLEAQIALMQGADNKFETRLFQVTDIDNGDVIKDNSWSSSYAVGVPGTVAGLGYAHQKYGTQRWYSLLQPAIE